MTYHIKIESSILERLLFRCKNNVCEEVFKLSELNQLLHQEKCD